MCGRLVPIYQVKIIQNIFFFFVLKVYRRHSELMSKYNDGL